MILTIFYIIRCFQNKFAKISGKIYFMYMPETVHLTPTPAVGPFKVPRVTNQFCGRLFRWIDCIFSHYFHLFHFDIFDWNQNFLKNKSFFWKIFFLINLEKNKIYSFFSNKAKNKEEINSQDPGKLILGFFWYVIGNFFPKFNSFFPIVLVRSAESALR